jgi:membrane-associated phospholipid phosphatase
MPHNFTFLLIAVLSCFTLPAAASDTTASQKAGVPQIIITAGKTLVCDGVSVITSPLHWKTKEWCQAGAVTAITAGLYCNDQEIKDWAQRNRNSTTDNASFAFRQAGEGFVVVPVLAAWWLGGTLFKNDRASNSALLCLESAGLSGAITHTLKLSLHRHRPFESDRYNVWDGPALSLDNNSFPSGHATTAFAWATIVAGVYNQTPLVGVSAYSLALLCALSRINDNQHWASDVFFGAALGWATSQMILKLHSQSITRHVMIIPTVQNKCCGLCMTCSFKGN